MIRYDKYDENTKYCEKTIFQESAGIFTIGVSSNLPSGFKLQNFGDLPVKSVLAKTDASTNFYDNYKSYAYRPCL